MLQYIQDNILINVVDSGLDDNENRYVYISSGAQRVDVV